MRRLLMIAGLFATVLLPSAAFAQTYDTPKAALEALYAPYIADTETDDRAFFSKALNGLYEADEANTQEGDMGAIDFDPVVNAQDYQITNLDISPAEIDGDTATVMVMYDNFGEPRMLDYFMVKEDGSWKVDDIESTDTENPWKLSELFAAAKDPMLN